MNRARGSWPLLPLLLSLAVHAGAIGLFGGMKVLSQSSAQSDSHPASSLLGVSVVRARSDSHHSPGVAPLPRASSPLNGDLVAAVSTRPAGPGLTSAPLDAAADAGSSGSTETGAELAAYAAQVRSRIDSSLRYPLSLRRRGVQGRVGLRLTLDEQGHVRDQALTERSGSAELDELALEAARAAAPYPLPPDALKKSLPVVLSLPIEFKLR